MDRPGSGQRFLGVGSEAPAPSGPEDSALKEAMLAQGRAASFRFRVNLWSRLTGRGTFDWEAFERRLAAAEFRRFANATEARRSLGWAGLTPDGRWLFGIAGYRIPFYGKSAMRHELFHAVQDFKSGLFQQPPGLLRSLAAEYSAHLWGGPLLGIPLAYGGSLCILFSVIYILSALAGIR
ncbi:MAG: hypothetical protein HYS12_18520 [Planctomycetes bacterium]|nr:hypothetical protein [Planctomycetota bacterium]